MMKITIPSPEITQLPHSMVFTATPPQTHTAIWNCTEIKLDHETYLFGTFRIRHSFEIQKVKFLKTGSLFAGVMRLVAGTGEGRERV